MPISGIKAFQVNYLNQNILNDIVVTVDLCSGEG